MHNSWNPLPQQSIPVSSPSTDPIDPSHQMPLKPSPAGPVITVQKQKPTSLFLINSNKPMQYDTNGSIPAGVANSASERAPLISIDVCSDEELRQSRLNNAIDNFNGEDVIVNYPGTKRHSTGDASTVAPFGSSLLSQDNPGQTRSSTVSLYDPSGNVVKRGRRGSNTAVTDF